MSTNRLTTVKANIGAEARAVEEGHRAMLAADHRPRNHRRNPVDDLATKMHGLADAARRLGTTFWLTDVIMGIVADDFADFAWHLRVARVDGWMSRG